MLHELIVLLGKHADGPRAWEDAAAVHALDRSFTFSAFHESARLSAERLRAAGLSSVEIIETPADGRSIFGDWMMPLAWECEEATFDLIGASGAAERVADRAKIPCCLAMWSAPTPAEGVEAEIVEIANPTDRATWNAESVRGKIVFTSAHPHAVKQVLLSAGAVGILSDFQSPRADLPDAVSWINAWSDDPGGWALTERDTRGWSFQVSPAVGRRIRERLAAGEKLRGRAVVRSHLGEGTLPTVTGVIPGSAKEEVVLLGHQFEQGAIDNASGIGVMIEAARVLQCLIGGGELRPPARSIRFLFVSECYTTMHWAETRREARRTIAGLCLDSPAGSPALALRPPEIFVNPHSMMSFADALILHLVEQVMSAAPVYAWREAPFQMGTDNNIADRTIGIPCPWIGGHSRTWHNSADVAELVDGRLQQLVAVIAAAYAYVIASADGGIALDLAHLAAARGKAAIPRRGVTETERAERDLNDSCQQIRYLAERQAEAVASVLRLLRPSERSRLRPQVRALQRDLRRAAKDEIASLARRAGRRGFAPSAFDPAGELAGIVPRRLVKGPVTFDRIAREDRGGRPSPRWSPDLFAILNWCDGRRSLAEACHLAARELRADRTPTPDELARRIDPNASSMLDYFEFLRAHGYVAW
jgi:hypothetical protein